MKEPSGSLYHIQPQLDDILNDVAPFPYTLGAFIAFLSELQCLETVEFLLETDATDGSTTGLSIIPRHARPSARPISPVFGND
jgi:hypothetical protein